MNVVSTSCPPACRTTTIRVAIIAFATGLVAAFGAAIAQAPVNTTPSRQTIEDAAQTGCDGASVVVRRCAEAPPEPAKKKPDDALTKSRAATKAAFDRRDRLARDAALQGTPVPASTPVGNAERLGPVTVTGRAIDDPPSIEEVLQRALNPPSIEVSPNGTVTHYGIDGSRRECIAKCVGPACCMTIRSLPNPARESNSIGR